MLKCQYSMLFGRFNLVANKEIICIITRLLPFCDKVEPLTSYGLRNTDYRKLFLILQGDGVGVCARCRIGTWGCAGISGFFGFFFGKQFLQVCTWFTEVINRTNYLGMNRCSCFLFPIGSNRNTFWRSITGGVVIGAGPWVFWQFVGNPLSVHSCHGIS